MPRSARPLLSAFAAVTALALAACSGGGGDATDDAAGEGGATTAERLRIGILSEEGNLTPHTYETGFTGLNLMMLSYDTLMQVDADGVPQPWLADEVDRSEDGLTYTITLADGVTWHDGEALDAEDVAFSVDYYKSGPPGRFQNALRLVDAASVVDPATVELTLSAPNPSFDLRTLADVPILPEHVWSDVAAPDTEPFSEETSVGSGPYRLTDSKPGTSYTLEANPDYFRGAPKVEQIVAVQFADDAGAIAALRSGEVDTLMRVISPEQIQALQGRGGLEVLEAPEYTTTLLAYDTQRPPFDDAEFRQALMKGIDVQQLVDDVYLGAAAPGNAGWVHPDSPYHSAVDSGYDPEAAANLLEQAGYTDGDGDGVREADGEALSLELLVAGNNALRLRIAELIATQLGEVGVGVKVSAIETQTLDDAVWPGYDVNMGRNYDMAIWGWSAPTQADIGQLAALVHSDPAIGNLNVTGFSDPTSDQLADELLATLDDAERIEVAGQLQERFAETAPFVPLLYPNGVYAYQSNVFGDWRSITGIGPMTKLSFIPDEGQP